LGCALCAFCRGPARRRFYQALQESVSEALGFIGQIRALYRIEHQARTLSPSERHPIRQEHALPNEQVPVRDHLWQTRGDVLLVVAVMHLRRESTAWKSKWRNAGPMALRHSNQPGKAERLESGPCRATSGNP